MQSTVKRTLILWILLASSWTMTSCSAFRFPGVFKIDVGQGNIVTQEMLDKLTPGMTQRQVLFVMGSPLIRDTFHANRWDYYYSFSRSGDDPQTHHIVLYFENGQFTHYSGAPNNPEGLTPAGNPLKKGG